MPSTLVDSAYDSTFKAQETRIFIRKSVLILHVNQRDSYTTTKAMALAFPQKETN